MHLVWEDGRDGISEIYYKRSTDNGLNWEEDTRLTYNGGTSAVPSIAISGQIIHLVWADGRDGSNNNEIYYKRSSNEGTNWSSDIRLTNNPARSYPPSIAVSGSFLHVVWEDNRNEYYDVYYKRSTDGGINWGADFLMNNDTSYSNNVSVAISGSMLHVVWNKYRDGNDEI